MKGYSQCITMDVDFSGASNTACPLHFYLVGIGRDGPGLGFNPPAYLNNVKTFRCCRSTRHNSTVAHTHTLTISFPNDQYMIGPKAVIYLSRFFAVFFIKELTKSPLKLLPKALPCSPVKPLPKARPCNPPKFYPLHPLKALRNQATQLLPQSLLELPVKPRLPRRPRAQETQTPPPKPRQLSRRLSCPPVSDSNRRLALLLLSSPH